MVYGNAEESFSVRIYTGSLIFARNDFCGRGVK